jgi:hypothetical protein
MIIFPDPVAARRRWKTLADTTNASQPTTLVTQKLSDGSTRTREVKYKAISPSLRKTGISLIGLFVGNMHRQHKRLGEAAFEQGPPAFFATRPQLADLWGCSERTAYDHLEKLKEVGLIDKRAFRGSRAAFSIILSSDILYGKAVENTVEKPILNINPHLLQPENDQNLPHSNVTVTHRNKETEIVKGSGEVDYTATVDGDTHDGNKKHGNTERQQPTSIGQPTRNPAVTVTIGGAGRRGAAHVDNRRRSADQLEAIFAGYVSSFWGYAKQILYPGRDFAAVEEQAALREIREGVYRSFRADLTEKEWDGYQTELFRRIEMAGEYFARHEDKYCPDPFSRLRPGAGYFCYENQRGFRVTDDWLAANMKIRRTAYVNQRLSLAIRHLQQHRDGRAPKMLQRKSYLEAYRYLENQVKRYGEGPHARFLAAAAAISTKVQTKQ